MWVRLDKVVAGLVGKAAGTEAPAQFDREEQTIVRCHPKAATDCMSRMAPAPSLDRRMEALNARIRLWMVARTEREEAPRPGHAARPRGGERRAGFMRAPARSHWA
jgi:hypothetical protein